MATIARRIRVLLRIEDVPAYSGKSRGWSLRYAEQAVDEPVQPTPHQLAPQPFAQPVDRRQFGYGMRSQSCPPFVDLRINPVRPTTHNTRPLRVPSRPKKPLAFSGRSSFCQ